MMAKTLKLPPGYIVSSDKPLDIRPGKVIWIEKDSGKNKKGLFESLLILIEKIINK
jgi:hypothetical protein